MLSLIRKILQAIKSYDTVLDRLGRIESTLTEIEIKMKAYDEILDENNALWQFIEDQRETEESFSKFSEDYSAEVAEIFFRNTKVQGDA